MTSNDKALVGVIASVLLFLLASSIYGSYSKYQEKQQRATLQLEAYKLETERKRIELEILKEKRLERESVAEWTKKEQL